MDHEGNLVTTPDALVERCRARLQALRLAPDAGLAATCRALQQSRGRRLIVMTSDPGELRLPSGMWMQFTDRDIVWADNRTSPLHRCVIIGHELGHIVCDHEPMPVHDIAPDDTIRALADDQLGLSLDHLSAIMGRCGDPALTAEGLRLEHEAEITGRILAEQFLRSHDPGAFVESLAEL